MLFNSVNFMLFLPLVVFLYYLCHYKYRWVILLISSYYFYMSWKPEYVALIFITTFMTYITGIAIEKAKSAKQKKMYLFLNLMINFSILFIFKYFNFVSLSLSNLFNSFLLPREFPILDLLLPVGISFYTFQALGYTIDVYRGDVKAEKHFGIFALFLSFFPQLVAGPIERSKHLLPQFYSRHYFKFDNLKDGFVLILWGLFKKIVIADRLSVFVNMIYNNPYEYSGLPLILATIFFAFQIFCDFSGYSDIAIGSSKILGFDLMNNFDRPYFSVSVIDFWRRWHISLSTWFKDYLYIPLGGNRVSKQRWCLNQFIVFFLSGLWHGASWNFVIWGTLHSIYIIIFKLTNNIREKINYKIGLFKVPKIHYILKILLTFILVDFAWIFFRANTLSDALYICTNLIPNMSSFNLNKLVVLLDITKFDMYICIGAIICLQLIEWIKGENSIDTIISEQPIVIRWFFCYIIMFAIILLGGYGYEETTQFIYFQF